jgi:hypothetical protein
MLRLSTVLFRRRSRQPLSVRLAIRGEYPQCGPAAPTDYPALRSIVKNVSGAGASQNRRGDINETANCRGRLAASLGSSYATAQEMRRVVTGLDERNHSVVLFDSKMPLKQVVPGIIATNFWITDTYPPSLLKDDPSGRPIGVAPPDNGTKFRVVEFLPLDAATEAKMPPEMLQKGITNAPTRSKIWG